MTRVLALFVSLVAVLLASPQDEEASLRARATAALSQTSGELRLPGLRAPVEVIRDRWGVPHIYAANTHDLFFAQGFVAAQDRLWQLDLWRRMAEGTLAEIVGPTAVNRDVLARLLRYRGDMDAEWRAYRPDAREIVEAFVAGVNAQVGIALSAPEKLPLEFQLTGSRPGRWTPGVVIGRMAGFIMTRNARSEVQRALLARAVGVARVPLFQQLDPPKAVQVPEGLDLADITDEIMALTSGVGETVAFPGARENSGAGEGHADPELDEIGSNDWVVSGRLSATGKPLLANDPHRTLMLPSLRYTVHLNAPGWNVIGAGEPALPGVAAGHNDRVAFGFTIVGMDQQDIYVEQLDPADHSRYRYRDGWEAMKVERDKIAVKGEPARELTLRFTRHGPVLHVDEARHRAYALRWVGTEPGAAGYLKSIALNTASDWRSFREAAAGWKVPSENLVYADVDGNIGWIAAGLAPVRQGWDGLMPVPGHEGRYEWSGFLRLDDLPQSFNPESGLLATANHDILPRAYSKVLSHEFGAPFRFGRILEVLGDTGGTRRFTVGDFERLQHDEQSVLARAVTAALDRAAKGRVAQEGRSAADTETYVRAVSLLAGWDGTLSKDSAPAALYQTWLPRLSTALAAALVPEADRRHMASVPTGRLFELLVASGLAPKPPWWGYWVDGRPGGTSPATLEPDATHRAVLEAALTGPTLVEAWRELAKRLGPDPGLWAWGMIHTASFRHALASTPAEQQLMNTGAVPRGGDGTTPNATGSGARQTAGASYREVIDVSSWDNSVMTNVPGQSGQPGSPHYADLFRPWAEGQYHPMLFSRAAVEKHAAARLKLVPAVARR
jgi:penicillin amidase